jgi:hypothetical protein
MYLDEMHMNFTSNITSNLGYVYLNLTRLCQFRGHNALPFESHLIFFFANLSGSCYLLQCAFGS